MKQATIKDVARKAGVSITTVSFVLNNSNPRISAETRERVLQAVKELDYHSNKLAASMVTRKSNILGLVIPDTRNVFFTELARLVTEEARKSGYAVLYGGAENDASRDIDYIHMFVDHRVDGIIIARSAPSEQDKKENEMLDYLKKLDIPFLLVDRMVEGSRCEAVIPDHRYGGYAATRHLISLGHTRIGCLTGPANLPTSMQRLQGYRDALEEAELPFYPELIFESNYTMEHGREALEYFRRQKASAIFCFNDMMALGLYRELPSYGMSVPEDISIVGYDNISFSDIVNPPLTTVSQPIAIMASLVVSRLVGLLEGNGKEVDAHTEKLMPELIVRKSTALSQAK